MSSTSLAHQPEDTTNRLLLVGWNLQHSVLAPGASAITLRLRPVAESHSLQVPSDDAETMKSLETDQSKSVREEQTRDVAKLSSYT